MSDALISFIRSNLRGALVGAGIGSLDVCRTLLVAEMGAGLAGRYVTGVFRQIALYAAVGFAFRVFSRMLGATSAKFFRDTIRGATRGEFLERTIFAALWVTAVLFGLLQGADESVFGIVAFSALVLTVAVLITRVRTGPMAMSPPVRAVRTAVFAVTVAAAALAVFVATQLDLNSLAGRATAAWRTETASRLFERPDVVLITVDTLRADRLTAYGGETARTPALDRLTAESLLFERAMAQAPWTRSSFGSIWTGQTPSVHRANWRILRGPDGKDQTLASDALDPGLATLPAVFADAGYLTVGINNNIQTSARFGFARGFTTWIDVSQPLHVADDSLLCRSARELFEVTACPLAGAGAGEYPYLPADRLTPVIMELVSRIENSDAPVFLWLHYMDPHVPYNFHEGSSRPLDYDTIRDELARDPDAIRTRLETAYDAEIEFMDRHLGTVLNRIDSLPRLQRAVIAFTSDHGEELVERWQPAGEREAGRWYELRGYGHGHTLHEELLHVPLSIRLPGKARAGERVSFVAQHTDILPTLAAVAGLGRAPMTAANGRNLAAIGRDEGSTREQPVLFAERSLYGPELKAARKGRLKLVLRTEDGSRRLYDLDADRAELRAVPYDRKPGGAELDEALSRWMDTLPEEENGATTSESGEDAGLRRQLEALGYLDR
jgi:arylsulfatase A-like enzyme